MDTLNVGLGDRGYDIHIGSGLLDRAGELMTPVLRQKRAFIVTDANVAPLYLDRLSQALDKAGIAAGRLILPAGEQTKDFAHLQQVLDAMLAARCERRTMVVALGGGVIGDLTGFAASILLRGVDFVQIPTTLLSQVDSSVGGKTGINSAHGKNLIGAFHQPRLVLADTGTLDSLPRREVLAGYAEVVKYGLIDDPNFFGVLEKGGYTVAEGNRSLRRHVVSVSCTAKARVVAADEREEGARALLNLGHTFGHALEAETGYGPDLLHGEAVAIGMVMAFDLSVRLGLCPAEDAGRVRAHLARVGLPVKPRDIGGRAFDPERLLGHMAQDKKVVDGRLTFILAHGIGKAFVSRDVAAPDVLALLADAVAA
ncbi:MAG: 3-dehydroquinate synthase [Alphaproteobacteria bacterium]|nr:3-dehydroquinate synthase [Alphaproteobacteria bacterium]